MVRTSPDGQFRPTLASLPAADVDVLEGILSCPFVPFPANQADGGSGIPLQHFGRNRTADVAGERSFLQWHGRLRHAKGEGDSMLLIELRGLLEDLGEDLVGEIVDVHWICAMGIRCCVSDIRGVDCRVTVVEGRSLGRQVWRYIASSSWLLLL